MLLPGKKTLLPFFVLLLAASGLLAVWWFSDKPDTGRSDIVPMEVRKSQKVLNELSALRDRNSPREFSASAREIIQKDRILSSDELNSLGDQLFRSGFVETAELCYRKSTSLNRFDESATSELARLLYVTGRIDEARTYLTQLLLAEKIDLSDLPMLGNSGLEWSSDVKSIQLHKSDTADLMALLGQASIAIRNQNIDLAKSLLETAQELPGEHGRSRLLLLRAECFSRTGDKADLVQLLASSSFEFRTANEYILSLQGKLCRNLGETENAIRCFWEAFRLNPNSILACSQLAELLESRKSSEVASMLRERAVAIRDYEDVCRQIHTSATPSEQQLGFAANAALKLHCLRESYAFSRLAEIAYPNSNWQEKHQSELRTMIAPRDQRFSQLYEWIALQEFSSYALPDWNKLSLKLSPKESDATLPIVFHDDTNSSGIEFQFEDAANVGSDTTRLFEFTGGGVAVLDLDLDTWPDIFFTQGGVAPELGNPEPNSKTPDFATLTDQLFRNQLGSSFRVATPSACLIDGGYSQGCTSGDFNMDGFPDLYVANIGQNQLFQNNGDGTFAPVAVPPSQTWTTSCAIADLTGDGVPDIYDVNQVIAAGVHQKMCRKQGTSVPCDGGQGLVAEQDRLFAGDGHGSFYDITEDSGIKAKDGLGLGLVVFQLPDSPGLSVFVANDARPNFLFVNQGTSAPTQFSDEAVVRGVALSGDGRSQACMGIAAGDANGDGTTDLLVTNFFNDYNTLYLQRDGFFNDSSDTANLIQSSYGQLGFGTQFLDADLDRDQDLVVTNGDVVDFSTEDTSRPYAQYPQVFRNRSEGNFEELSRDVSGNAFQTPGLGRGLARLDWNADGRPDFVVSNIRSPAILATNHTATTNRYLAIQLVGTQSPRQPIGAIVQVTTSAGELQCQLTAGDGYMACNENLLLFGLGDQQLPVALTIQWPSGRHQTLASVGVDCTLVVVESGTSAIIRKSAVISE